MQASLSAQYGANTVYAQGIATFLMWIIYHTYSIAMHNMKKKKGSLFHGEPVPYLSKANSAYFEQCGFEGDQTYRVKWMSFMGPIGITLINFAGQTTIAKTFEYGYYAGMNNGVLATIFSSSTLFTIVFFLLFFKQIPSKMDVLGSAMIITCICLIGFT
jgi:hypothetical protein